MAIKKQIEIEVVNGKAVANVNNLTNSVNRLDDSLENVSSEARKTNAEMNNLSKASKKIQQSAGLAGATVQELGRGISDLPYGIRGVANNLSQIGSLFTTLIVSAGGFKNALIALKGAMMGPLGVLTIFQVFTALIQTDMLDGLFGITKAQKAYTNALKDGAEAASDDISKLNTLLDTARNVNLSLDERKRAIELINENYPEYLGNLSIENLDTEAQNTLIEKNIEFLNKQALAKALQAEKSKLYQELIAAENSSLVDNISFIDQALNFLGSGASIFGVSIAPVGIEGAEQNKQDNIDAINKQIEDLDNYIQQKIEDSELDITDIFKPKKKKKEKKEKKDRGFDTTGDDLSFLENLGFTAEEIEEGIETYDASIQETYDIEAYWEDKRLEKAAEASKKRIEVEEAEKEAKRKIRDASINAVAQGFRILQGLSEKNKGLQAVGIVGENAIGIAKTIINTQSANAAAVLKYALVPGGQALAAAEITANKINAGVSIATSIAATAKALSTIGRGGNSGASFRGDGGRGVTTAPTLTQATPSFNVVGRSETNQLAQTIGQRQQEPIKAYVVSTEVTTQQSLDRNVISTASFG